MCRLFERAPEFLAQQQNLSFDGAEAEGETLDRLAQMGFRQPQEVAAAVRKWRDGLYRGAARRAGARQSRPSWCRPSSINSARAENPDAAFAAFDRFLGRTARRRPLSFAVAAESGTDPLCRADPRHRAAACRYSGAKSALHRSADRSELLRLAARRDAAGSRACARARRDARLRGRRSTPSACSARSTCS